MGWIEQRENGRYKAAYRDPFGKRRTKTFDRLGDAKRWVREREAAKDMGSVAQPEMRLEDWVSHWRRITWRGLSPATQAKYDYALDTHILPELGKIRIGSITTAVLDDFIRYLFRRGLAPATIRSYWAVLNQTLEAARVAKVIDTLPPSPKMPRARSREGRFLTRDEVSSLAQAIDPRYRSLIFFLAYTGLRIGEAAGLDWSQVQGCSVHVIHSASENGGYRIDTVKTKASRRTVYMPEWVAAQMPARERGLVFRAPDGIAPLRVNSWRRRFFVPAVQKARLTPLRPHDLRHTFASFAIASGVDPKTLQVVMGHTSASFTLDIYSHLMTSAAADVAAKFEHWA